MVVIFFLNTEKNLDVQTQQSLLTNQHKYRKKIPKSLRRSNYVVLQQLHEHEYRKTLDVTYKGDHI